MDSHFFLYLGFIFAGYSVIGNDVIQTLGTFLTSNNRRPWYVLWAYAASILTATVLYGWFTHDGDVSYSRLSSIPLPENVAWWYILPPVILLIITRIGFPVSTTFMILSVFSEKQVIGKMIEKSLIGYLVAFVFAGVVYLLITKKVEKSFLTAPSAKVYNRWVVAQWLSTGFLWTQWLIQDFANIYVYLPRQLDWQTMLISLVFLLGLLAYIFYQKGGAIQKVVTNKTNTADIRSATLIDFVYGLVLLIFTEINPVPMSTTWAFLGVLAGREYALNFMLQGGITGRTHRIILLDLAKVFAGFLTSIILVFLIRQMAGL